MKFPKIKDLRDDNEKTQEEIAQILHCHREVYRRYETGVYEIPTWAVIALARYYNVTTDYLLGLTREKRPFPKK